MVFEFCGTKQVAVFPADSRLLDFGEHFSEQASKRTLALSEMISVAVAIYTQESDGPKLQSLRQ